MVVSILSLSSYYNKMKEEKEYSGIWKDFGCILSAIAIIGILALIATLIYQFVSGA
ncbi:hypothetical protein [Croceitalea vernalis]|uniref:Uncharacterized protein n=1 Tax=Croceitalea vernalis TaxID=3075599 RepID=A0ABU3BGW6_9FLAO|nr:hypothetical protein [Croceitalea sp. P007]MDT0621407.1 hypothetical protein [Croceitalea sp. P007]